MLRLSTAAAKSNIWRHIEIRVLLLLQQPLYSSISSETFHFHKCTYKPRPMCVSGIRERVLTPSKEHRNERNGTRLLVMVSRVVST